MWKFFFPKILLKCKRNFLLQIVFSNFIIIKKRILKSLNDTLILLELPSSTILNAFNSVAPAPSYFKDFILRHALISNSFSFIPKYSFQFQSIYLHFHDMSKHYFVSSHSIHCLYACESRFFFKMRIKSKM